MVVATGGATAAALLPGLTVPDTRTVTTVYHAAPASPLDEPTLLVDTEGEILNTCVLTDVSRGYGTGRALVSTSVLGGGGEEREPAIRARLAEVYQTGTAGWEHLAAYTIDGALPAMPAPLRLSQPCRVPGLDGTGLRPAPDPATPDPAARAGTCAAITARPVRSRARSPPAPGPPANCWPTANRGSLRPPAQIPLCATLPTKPGVSK